MPWRRPDEPPVLLNVGFVQLMSDRSLAPRALRDITAADRVGRFHVADPELAVTVAAGALLGLTHLLHDQPERDSAQAADQVTEDLLRMYGLSADEAREVCPLRDTTSLHEVVGGTQTINSTCHRKPAARSNRSDIEARRQTGRVQHTSVVTSSAVARGGMGLST